MDKEKVEKVKKGAPAWSAVVLAVATAITTTVQHMSAQTERDNAEQVRVDSDKYVVEQLLDEIDGLNDDVDLLNADVYDLKIETEVESRLNERLTQMGILPMAEAPEDEVAVEPWADPWAYQAPTVGPVDPAHIPKVVVRAAPPEAPAPAKKAKARKKRRKDIFEELDQKAILPPKPKFMQQQQQQQQQQAPEE
jgi:hypothetical protein